MFVKDEMLLKETNRNCYQLNAPAILYHLITSVGYQSEAEDKSTSKQECNKIKGKGIAEPLQKQMPHQVQLMTNLAEVHHQVGHL